MRVDRADTKSSDRASQRGGVGLLLSCQIHSNWWGLKSTISILYSSFYFEKKRKIDIWNNHVLIRRHGIRRVVHLLKDPPLEPSAFFYQDTQIHSLHSLHSLHSSTVPQSKSFFSSSSAGKIVISSTANSDNLHQAARCRIVIKLVTPEAFF